MKVSSFFTAAFATIAAASPVSEKRSAFSSQQLAKFDNLPSVPAISELSPVGTYSKPQPDPQEPPRSPTLLTPKLVGLVYNSFNVLQQGVLGIITTGIKPQSGLNVAANGITDSVLRGGPAISPAKGYKSFDLQSLYFACVVNSVESAAGVPQQCTIAFTAYKPGSSKPFETINKQFNPTNPLLSKMVKAEFPRSWTKLARVDVATVQATTTSTLSGLLIDNVSYKLNK